MEYSGRSAASVGKCLTKRLSGIWHAWHFQFALSSVVTALCGSFCIACLHPLTRR
ncbi:DUF3265 domain-containing protein [Vibrio vulnificus]|nr:DUF3265 domain-containing protein [Vibrio vulnificus]EHH0747103.1 DUF3265 domain-containing protein [Vibrio vulnificus]